MALTPPDDYIQCHRSTATREYERMSGANPEAAGTEDSSSGPNLAAFLLTVAGVTVAFITVFVFSFPGIIGRFFAGAVIAVTIITLIVGMVLDLLGYFGNQQKILTQPTPDTATGVPESVRKKPNRPLPKRINFDEEIETLREYFDGELPPQMDSFLTEYMQLKTSTSNRKVKAGSLRAALNPIQTLVAGDEEMEELVTDMGDQLFSYIKADPVDNIVVTEHAFYRDGHQYPVEELQAENARIKATVHNQGESAKAEVAVQFKNTDDVPVKTAYLPVGNLVPEARKDLNTNVYVPSLATSASVFVIRATQDTEVLSM
jgi:hypothetical protein